MTKRTGWLQRSTSGKWFRVYVTKSEANLWYEVGDRPLLRVTVVIPKQKRRSK